MTQQRSVEQKVADTVMTFNALQAEVVTPAMRGMIDKLTNFPAPELPSREDLNAMEPEVQVAVVNSYERQMRSYASLIEGGMAVARLVAAGERTAMLAAAILNQSGVVKPVFTQPTDGGEEV